MSTEYTILDGWTIESLLGKVRCYLAAGWEPSGGVAVCSTRPHDERFYQAMVRRSILVAAPPPDAGA